MHLSTNISHWVCLLAGLYLVLTGFLLRDIMEEQQPALTTPAGSRGSRHAKALGLGRRIMIIAVGLAAAGYALSRMIS